MAYPGFKPGFTVSKMQLQMQKLEYLLMIFLDRIESNRETIFLNLNLNLVKTHAVPIGKY
jgi:hypothetical protein